MDNIQGFGDRIKTIREYRNLSVEKAAEMCNASLSAWKQYERGVRLPSVPKLKMICLALQVKPEYLFGSELDGLQSGKDVNEMEQLKLKIEQLTPDDIAVIDAAVSKRLEINQK